MAHMDRWPGEFYIDSRAFLYSLSIVLLILALAECPY